MGLLDNLSDFAASDAGMGLAQGLLSANGSQGIAAGLAGMQRAKQMQLENEMKRQAMASQALQMQAAQLQLENAKRDSLKQAEMQKLFSQFSQSPTVGKGATDQVNSALPPQFQIGSQPAIQGGNSQGGYDYQGLQQALARVDPMAALSLGEKLKKENPKFGTEPRVGINPATNKAGTYIVAENGATKWIDALPRDKLNEVNLGGKIGFRNDYDTQIQGITDTFVKPDTLANNQVTMRGQNMTDARSRDANSNQQNAQRTQLFQTPEGILSVDKGTGQAAPVMMGGKPVRSEDAMKKSAGANNVLALVDQAEELLPGATGSVVGSGIDLAGSAVGYATSGAQKIAQLKTIEGALIGSMPRMEGPQSDADRMLYQKAAGDIANPMAPVKSRQAALNTLREIQNRYATQQPATTGSSGGWSIKPIP